MTSVDWAMLIALALSTLLAFFRGVVRELIALIAWIAGLLAAIAFAPPLAAMIPDIPGHPAFRYLIAFSLIVICALLLGALIAWPISRAIRAAGLGFVDRFLGAIFGIARGVVLLTAFVFVAGLTPMPKSSWWQASALMPPLVAGVYALKPRLPAELAGRLDYSPGQPQRKTAPVEQQASIALRGPEH